jgi:molybdate transport system ATP-binding protein
MLEVAFRHRFPGLALDVAFTAPPGLTVLFGASGSGKTTIVNAVAGLLMPQDGRIAVGGTVFLDTEARLRLPAHRRRIGYVFQDARLFPHLTVRQHLPSGRWFAGGGGALEPVVDLLGIGPLLSRRPGALSGGERMRVALGRALLCDPAMILADEPLAALDEARRAEVLPHFERLRDEARVPVLYVSHAASEVARLATTVVAVEAGRVTRAGPAAAVLADPGAPRPLGVRAAGSVLAARVVAHHADGLTEIDAGGSRLWLPRIAAAPGTALRVRIAAQDVILSTAPPQGLSALNVIPGQVREISEGSGPGVMVAVEAGGGTVLARLTRRSAVAMGLAPGLPVWCITKSVAVAPEDVGMVLAGG